MRRDDLSLVAQLHVQHFPDGFFARLGQRFVSEYYDTFHTDRSSCTLVAEYDGAAIGYIVGSPDPHLHRQHAINRHGHRLAWLAFLSLVARPRLAIVFIRTRTWRYTRALLRRRRVSSTTSPATSAAVLHHLVVMPEHQGQGIGSLLIAELELAARAAGCDQIVLVTRSDGAAPAYYRRTGWTDLGDHGTADGHRLTTFARPLATHHKDFPTRCH